jgi:hypothetical protein
MPPWRRVLLILCIQLDMSITSNASNQSGEADSARHVSLYDGDLPGLL